MTKSKHFTKAMAVAFTGLLLAGGLIACTRDDSNDAAAISEADAVNAIQSSTASTSNGLAKTTTDASALAETEYVYTASPQLTCGEAYTNSYSADSSGVYYSYDYTGTKTYTLGCSAAGMPQTFNFNATMAGTYDTPRMYSDDNATSTFTVTGLEAGQANAVFNGSYVRNGYQESKVLQMRHFNSVLTYTLTGVNISKSTRKIVSGTAAVSFVGTGSGGNTYTYNGTITFNGGDTATLVINGNTYTINL